MSIILKIFAPIAYRVKNLFAKHISTLIIACCLLLICGLSYVSTSEAYQIGVYYFPGWERNSLYWNDLKGLPGSRSPGRRWLEREPLLGFNYPEGEEWIAEKHISWAANYGIDFFIYDWYWDGKTAYLNHAIDAFLKVKNNSRMKFCLLWANHFEVPANIDQFKDMVRYWIEHYFRLQKYMQYDGKPVIFIFSKDMLKTNASKFGMNTKQLLELARDMAVKAGLKGIYFVACSQALDNWVKDYLPNNLYDAVSGYNYQRGYSGKFEPDGFSTTYGELAAGYKQSWTWILENSPLPYFIPVTSGWSRKPWGSNTPHDECVSSPETFRKHLLEAKTMLDQYPKKTKQTVVICCWNEFGEGSYIEPTKKWQFQYLQMIKDVFGK